MRRSLLLLTLFLCSGCVSSKELGEGMFIGSAGGGVYSAPIAIVGATLSILGTGPTPKKTEEQKAFEAKRDKEIVDAIVEDFSQNMQIAKNNNSFKSVGAEADIFCEKLSVQIKVREYTVTSQITENNTTKYVTTTLSKDPFDGNCRETLVSLVGQNSI